MTFIHNDGGRAAAGYKGKADDCVARSLAIATGRPYADIYERLATGNATQRQTRTMKASRRGVRTASHGINTKRLWFADYALALGLTWTPTMGIGTGCRVHLVADELPAGRLVVNVSKHLTAVIDGVIHDTHDCSRAGTRCVYGYWTHSATSL